MKIGIDINEVIRNFRETFRVVYEMNYGDMNIKTPIDTYDLKNHYIFKDNVSVQHYIKEESPEYLLKHQLDKARKNASDYNINEDDALEEVIEFKSKNDEFNNFLYEENIFEIFGSTPLMERNIDVHLNKLIYDLKDEHDIYIIGTDENYLTIPFTNNFLSKNSIKSRYNIFTKKPEDAWNFVDVMVTSNPHVLTSKGKNNKSIKIVKLYNEGISSDIEITSLKELTSENKLMGILI